MSALQSTLRGGDARLKAALASSDPGGVNPALACGDGSWVSGSCHEGDPGDRIAPAGAIRGDDTTATTGIAGWGGGMGRVGVGQSVIRCSVLLRLLFRLVVIT